MKEINKINQEQTIAIVQTRKDIEFIKGKITNIEDRIDNIENNHLKDIRQQLNAQKNILISTLITTIMLLVGIIFQILTR